MRSQATRALPGLVTMLAWERDYHVRPVFEDDFLRTDFEIIECTSAERG